MAASLRHARAGNRRALLDELLAAWHERPAAELADAIEAVSPDEPRRDLAGKSFKATSAWLACAARNDPCDVLPLLATLTDHDSKAALERLAALDGRPPDPRIDAALFDLLITLHHPGRSTRPFWIGVLDRAARVRDRRLPSKIPFIRLSFERFDTNTIAAMRARLDELEATLASTLASPAVVSDAERDALAVIARTAAPSGPTRAQLLANIFADPEGDGPRLVYADWLQQRGDPHGEVIALQILGGDDARVTSLLSTQAPRWLGPLGPLALWKRSDLDFERGFLARAKILRDVDLTAGSPWWSTVRELDGGAPILATHPVLHRVERLVLRHVCWAAFASGPQRALRELDVRIPTTFEPDGWERHARALGAATTLPALRTLSIAMREWIESWHESATNWQATPAHYTPLLDGSLVAQLESLCLEARTSRVGAWKAAIAARAPALRTLRLICGAAPRPTLFDLRRDGDPGTAPLRVHRVTCFWPRLADVHSANEVIQLLALVGSLEPDDVGEELEVAFSYRWAHRPEDDACVDACRRLAAVAQRFPRLREIVVPPDRRLRYPVH